MAAFVQGWGFTLAALVLITGVFLVALVSLARELSYVRTLTDQLGIDLAHARDANDDPGKRDAVTLRAQEVRDELGAVANASDRAWAMRQVRGWQMRAQRLEPALGFWVDFLRQLGLLFTVVGLGLSLAVERGDVTGLLQPLSLAVWTTVAGLSYSVWLSAQFGMKIPVWTDTCEKNIEAWDQARQPTEERG